MPPTKAIFYSMGVPQLSSSTSGPVIVSKAVETHSDAVQELLTQLGGIIGVQELDEGGRAYVGDL